MEFVFDENYTLDILAKIGAEECNVSYEEMREALETAEVDTIEKKDDSIVSSKYRDRIRLKEEMQKEENEQRLYNEYLNIYSLFELLYGIENSCHNINVLDRKIENLLSLIDQLKQISSNNSYHISLEKSIVAFERTIETNIKPDYVKFANNLTDEKYIKDVITNSVVEYFDYWVDVINSYKRENARVNRKKALEENYYAIGAKGLYMYDDILSYIIKQQQILNEL